MSKALNRLLLALLAGSLCATAAAAKAIKFTPAQKDGRPVSQYVVFEYNFNIY